jgi:hypothetical protein
MYMVMKFQVVKKEHGLPGLTIQEDHESCHEIFSYRSERRYTYQMEVMERQ